MATQTRHETAEAVAETVRGYCGWRARVWSAGDHVRVYCSRGGQDCGYIAITDDGELEWAVTRNRAGLRAHVEASL
jgi:hypothetical protein